MSGYAWLRLSYGRRLVVVSGPLAEAQASKRPGWHLVGTKGGCNRSALNKGTAETSSLPTLASWLLWLAMATPSSFSHVTCISDPLQCLALLSTCCVQDISLLV